MNEETKRCNVPEDLEFDNVNSVTKQDFSEVGPFSAFLESPSLNSSVTVELFSLESWVSLEGKVDSSMKLGELLPPKEL